MSMCKPFAAHMRTLRTLFRVLLVAAPVLAEAGFDPRNGGPGLGRPVPDYQGTIVSGDGSGLPQGSSSAAQGEAIFALRCAACHGVDGQLAGNSLVGGIGSLATASPLKTVGSYWPYAPTLYDYIARAMPYNDEKSLTVDEVYAVTAYVLYLNRIVELNQVLSDKNLADVNMPNRGGFIELQE